MKRCVVAGIALPALIWTILVFRTFWIEAPIVGAAAHIVSGDRYKPETLEGLLSLFRKLPSDRRRSLDKFAILQLRQAENAISSGDQSSTNLFIDAATVASTEALTRSPTDSFQWLALFSLSNLKYGANPEYVRFLRMSYEYGAQEGWIAARRLPVALELFSSLPQNLREAALIEFVNLVNSEMYSEAADVADRAGRLLRFVLFARLKDVSVQKRQSFAATVFQRNLDDVPIPGIERRPSRPWR